MPDRRIVLALAALAIAARVAAILALGSHQVERSTYEHGEIAANLLAGRGFAVQYLGGDGPTSQQAPLYPVLVAAAFAVGGVGSPAALLLIELSQAALGGLLVVVVVRLTARLVPENAYPAYAAGLIVSVHPTLVYAATHVQVASLAVVGLPACLLLADRLGRTGRNRDAVAAGGALALLVLVDPILGLVAPAMAWTVARGVGGWRPSLRPLAMLLAVFVGSLTPWVARNYRVHGEFVPVKSSFGYAFWQGNCAASEGTDKVVRPSVERALQVGGAGRSLRDQNRALWEARHEAGCIDDIVLTADDRRAMGRMTEPERSRHLFRRAVADLRAEPGRYVWLTLRRLRYFVLFDETNPKTRHPVYRASHLGLTLLAVVGLTLAPGSVRRRLGPTLLTAGLITAFHALTIVSARFHLPIEPLMAVWGAAGLTRLAAPASAPGADVVVGVGVERRLLGVG